MTNMDDLEPLDRATTASIIADKIRAGIHDGTFPPGAQLGEARLAERLGVSRGPVREALQRLIQEGLLESRPHRGVFVRTLDAAEIEDIYLARSAIERTAARRLAGRSDGTDLAELRSVLTLMEDAAQRGSWDRVIELDLEYHAAMVDASGSRRLLQMFRTLMIETSMCLRALEDAYPVKEELVAEHRELHRAILERDPDTAADIVGEHLASALRELTAGNG